MKKFYMFYMVLISIFVLFSCGEGGSDNTTTPEDPPEIITFLGVVEKGALQQGADIQASEWSAESGYSRIVYTSTTSDNKGTYNISSSTIQGLLDIRADGFFINENTGIVENSRIILSGLADSSTEKGNINIVTHIIKQRVIYLIQNENKTFDEATAQAIGELYAKFNWTIDDPLNISVADNAKLLFLSAVICKDKTVSEVSNLITTLSSDMLDGDVDISMLHTPIANINCTQIESNITALYGSSPNIDPIRDAVIAYLGIVITPPDPEDPVITYSSTRNMTAISTDAVFYYFEDVAKKLWRFKGISLLEITGSYTTTTYTYYDGVLQPDLTVTSAPTPYIFTDFYSIGTGASKILYFIIDSKNYKQENGVVSEITTLPTKPVKSKVVYSNSTLQFLVENNRTRINRYMSSAWIYVLVDEVNSYIYSTTSNWGSGYIINVSNSNSSGDFTQYGLYILPDSGTVFCRLIYNVKGEMW